ncbi:MAG: LacI family DNA-binding transcriptional regulator [Faecousia sp.]
MATIKEIAQAAGVSIGTVDRVIHNRGKVKEETQRKIQEVIRQLDYQPNQAAQGLALMKKKLKIGYLLPRASMHPFFKDVVAAARQKARELEQYGVQVNMMEPDYTLIGQEAYWDELLRQTADMDGMVIFAFPFEHARNFAMKVSERNIPVVFCNRYYSDVPFLAYVGCDYGKAGRMAAGLCALSAGEDARIVIYSENYDAKDYESGPTQSRHSGFLAELQERYPDMTVLEERYLTENAIDDYISAVDMLGKYPEVNAVYVMQSGNYNICEALCKADSSGKIRVITHDLTEIQARMMRRGMITATICQQPEEQGAQSLEILFRYLAYGEIPGSKFIFMDQSVRIAQSL